MTFRAVGITAAGSGDNRPGSVTRCLRSAGLWLLGQYCVVVWWKVSSGCVGDLLWVSHVSLVMAGLGCLVGRAVFREAAFVLILVPHSIWLLDFLGWVVGGGAVLGLTDWLAHEGWLGWVATSHHFYLSGLLLGLVWLSGGWERMSLWVAVAAFLSLTVCARGMTEPADNVNWAWGVAPGIHGGVVGWVNRLAGEIYLLALNLGAFALAFLPAASAGAATARWGARRRHKD